MNKINFFILLMVISITINKKIEMFIYEYNYKDITIFIIIQHK